jgi:UDP-N-acetylglucosamine--dolichyl-phosphate N-acetylglucosaminephosphotransferase
MGVIVGVVYFVLMFLFIPIPFLEWIKEGSYIEGQHAPFPHDKVYRNLLII